MYSLVLKGVYFRFCTDLQKNNYYKSSTKVLYPRVTKLVQVMGTTQSPIKNMRPYRVLIGNYNQNTHILKLIHALMQTPISLSSTTQ